jgi:hypothetical protein
MLYKISFGDMIWKAGIYYLSIVKELEIFGIKAGEVTVGSDTTTKGFVGAREGLAQ